MRICIIIDDYLPESIKVAAKMMHEMAVDFVSENHQVTVVTPGVNISAAYETLNLNNVQILRFKSGEIKNTSKLKRLINELLLPIKAWSSLHTFFKSNHHDLVIYYSPSIFWGHLVKKLKRLWKVPSYLILRDFFPQWVIDNGMLSQYSPLVYFFRIFENSSYEAANRIGIMSPANLRWFNSKYPRFKNTEVLYNWVTDHPILQSKGKYRELLNLKEKIVFFYGGNIGHAQDMGNVLRLAKRLEDRKDVHFVLVGAGDEVGLVSDYIKTHDLSNLTLLDPVSQLEYREMLAEFDVGLFTLHRAHTTHNFPGKILGYMVQGIPVLGCVNPGNDLMELINETQSGYVSVSGDDEVFYQNALQLLNHQNRMQIGINCKRLCAEKFSIKAASRILINLGSNQS
ncbi:glycosyltransferase WbuB [Leptospira ognonensis]|uniref:Glycosyltransferase WbuB n=1 Tax=Leptospira ognonensis TaxID=2484945 RepID=A0A4R9JZN5_9LEPT|nr:glycosyltransferase family 4 protein [Leptospira ognonensis]TGL57209.1 glycosyltransferase WbuB [Leptospira ognonensis]